MLQRCGKGVIAIDYSFVVLLFSNKINAHVMHASGLNFVSLLIIFPLADLAHVLL